MVKTLTVKGKPVSYSYQAPGRFLFDVAGKKVQGFTSPDGKSLIVSHGLFFGVTIRETPAHDLEIVK